MRQRLEEKNRMIEKKTQAAMQAQQERNRMNTELTELKDHMDIKDRKINVLQRKVSALQFFFFDIYLVGLKKKIGTTRKDFSFCTITVLKVKLFVYIGGCKNICKFFIFSFLSKFFLRKLSMRDKYKCFS